MSLDCGGEGLILIGPPGTKKTELFFGLLQDQRFRLHSSEMVFIRYAGQQALADCPERKLFIPTSTVECFPRLAPLFDHSKTENVIIHKEDCKDLECQDGMDCRLDRGFPYCFRASKDSHVLLDPAWIAGPQAQAKRISLRRVFILRNDPVSPAAVRIDKDEALRILEAGEAAGAKKSLSPAKPQPFYNPHLLVTTPERMDLQKSFFKQLLEAASVYLFNSGVGTVETIREIITSGKP
jgi:hypothetical protein